MRLSIAVVIIAALAAVLVVAVAGGWLLQPPRALVTAAGFSLAGITPNADGVEDVARFDYTLTRTARVTITLEAADGRVFTFRQDQPRIPDAYSVLFSGVVDGYMLEGEQVEGEIVRRLMPNGAYTWRLVAIDEADGREERTGTLTIQAADAPLPEIQNFAVVPNSFTPNQDGVADRTSLNLYLTKEADLTVYLVAADGTQIFIPETKIGREKGAAGRHFFDYDGGIDLGVQPPPDGTYTVVAEAQDAEGQRTRQTAQLTITNGGDPQAEIAPQVSGVDVVFFNQAYEERFFTTATQMGDLLPEPTNALDLAFDAITMPVNDLLVFKLTVDNYGTVPIRTSGPWPGTVYQQEQVWGAMGVYEQSGAWRVGLNCSTTTRDFPWRWAIGTPDNLAQETDERGNTFYYLPAGASSTVWGAVRLTHIVAARNPQQCWAGLIHEDVEVSTRNARVGVRDIELISPDSPSGG